MITRNHGDISFECDGCGEALDTGESEFSDALVEMKNAGWVSFKDALGEWEHRCEECKGKGR